MPACGLAGWDLCFCGSTSQSQFAEGSAFHLCESLLFAQACASCSVIYKQCFYPDSVSFVLTWCNNNQFWVDILFNLSFMVNKHSLRWLKILRSVLTCNILNYTEPKPFFFFFFLLLTACVPEQCSSSLPIFQRQCPPSHAVALSPTRSPLLRGWGLGYSQHP